MKTDRREKRIEKHMSEEAAAKYAHMKEKKAENKENLKKSMVGHLSTLNDGVIAIFITVMMLEIPFPTSREEYYSFAWSILVFFVSFFIIADFWYESKRIFEVMREADHFTVVVNFIYLAVLALIPATTKWILHSVDRYSAINFGIVYFLTMLSQEFLRYAALRKRFVSHKGLFWRLALSRFLTMTAIIAVLLVLSWHFPRPAIFLYVALPVTSFFMPERE